MAETSIEWCDANPLDKMKRAEQTVASSLPALTTKQPC